MSEEEHVIDLDEQTHWWREMPISECGDCGGTEFEAVVDVDLVVFQCVKCHSRWHAELGHVHRVGPAGVKPSAFEADTAR